DAVRRQGRGRALERRRAGGDRLGAAERARARTPTHPGPPRRPRRAARPARHPALAPVPRTPLARAVARLRGHPSDGGAVTPGWPRRLRSVAIGGGFLVRLAGCTSDGEGNGPTSGSSGTAGSSAPGSMRLEVLVDNVEYGGDAGTDAVIDAIDADIVGVL